MLKSILIFIKAHIAITAITSIVIVGTAIATPIVINNYVLDKNVKENLGMLVSSNYITNNNEITTNVIIDNNQILSNNYINTNEPLTFRIEKVRITNEGGNLVKDMKDEDAIEMSNYSIEYKIVPSYDKDYSKWTKQEKQAYQKALEEAAKMAEEQYYQEVANEEKIMRDLELKLKLVEQSQSKYYSIGVGSISYNSYTKKYTGSTWKNGKWNAQGIYEADVKEINISAQEFRNNLYPQLINDIKEECEQIDIKGYLANLNELYHLSD